MAKPNPKRKVAKVAADDLVQRGLLNNRNVEFTDCQWAYFDYIQKGGSKMDVENRAVAFIATIVALDDQAAVESIMLKIGDERFYEPEGDVLYALGEGDGAASKTSNWGIFVASLEANGVPKALQESLAEKASNLNGLKAHIVRQKVERSGTDATGRPIKDSEVPVVQSILALPGEKGSGKAKGGKTKAKSKPADDDDSDSEVGPDEAREYVLAAIAANEDDLTIAELPGEVMSALIVANASKAKRNAIRDWVRDQGEDLSLEGVIVAGGKVVADE